MKPVPLFGYGIESYSRAVNVQTRVNCYYDIRLDQDKHATIIRGTPGSRVVSFYTDFPIRGFLVAGDLIFIVSGSTLLVQTTASFLNFTGSATNVGSLSTNRGLVDMAWNGVQVLIVDGTFGYIYTIVTGTYYQAALDTAGSFGKITDPNFPNGATTCCFFNTRFLANLPNSLREYISGLDSNGIAYDGTRWTEDSTGLPSYISKENTPDYLLAGDILNGTIILWGGGDIEFWQDVGTSPQPYARISGATQTWGLAALNSRAFLNNTIFFLGRAQEGGIQIMALQGNVPVRVSTSDVEDIISKFSTWNDATALSYIIDGHPMYQINFPTADRSFMYDALTNFWYIRQTGLSGRHVANVGVSIETKTFFGDADTSNVYIIDSDVYTDNGEVIQRKVTSRHIDNNGNRMAISELVLEMETGVGLITGQGSDPQIMMRVSKDGGYTWGLEKWESIGAIGNYAERARWKRLGQSRNGFVFEFTMTDPVKFIVIKGDAKISPSASMMAESNG